MANVNIAIDYTLGFEDSTLSGKITVDDGGRTRFGIAEKWHPELTASLFYTSMGRDAALSIARGIYSRSYADPLSIADIANQGIANKLLSLGVDIGIKPVSKMLQASLGIEEDGVIGVRTLMRMSTADPTQVLDDLRATSESYYRRVAADRSEDEKFLKGWLVRARA